MDSRVPMEVERCPRPPVTAVVLNYNGGELATRCVSSLLAVDYTPFRVLVVDNASTDGSDVACERLDGAEVVRTGRNLGYTGGNNAGLRRALVDGTQYVLVVNNDVEVVNRRFVAEMVEFMDAHPRVGIAGPKVYFRERGRVQNTLCELPLFWRQLVAWPLKKLGMWPRQRSGDAPVEPEVLNGVCILLRRAFLEEVGLMDEAIFMYRDDTDLALRARRAGWKLAYVPVESIVHLQRTDGYDYLGMVDFLLKRNAVYVLRRHGRRLDALGHAAAGLTLSFLRALRLRLSGRPADGAWRFCRLLAAALRAALRGDTASPAFGPPAADWKAMMEGDRGEVKP